MSFAWTSRCPFSVERFLKTRVYVFKGETSGLMGRTCLQRIRRSGWHLGAPRGCLFLGGGRERARLPAWLGLGVAAPTPQFLLSFFPGPPGRGRALGSIPRNGGACAPGAPVGAADSRGPGARGQPPGWGPRRGAGAAPCVPCPSHPERGRASSLGLLSLPGPREGLGIVCIRLYSEGDSRPRRSAGGRCGLMK